MKWAVLFLLVFLLGCSTINKDQTWLTAAQQMVEVNHDPLVSTPNPDRARLFIKWAKDNGYKVKVSSHDPVVGFNPNMYFIVVSK